MKEIYQYFVEGEDELIRSTDIDNNFDIEALWSQKPPRPFEHIQNEADIIKIKKKVLRL